MQRMCMYVVHDVFGLEINLCIFDDVVCRRLRKRMEYASYQLSGDSHS